MPAQAAHNVKPMADIGIAALERKAGETAGLLKLLANENRLLVLCRLAVDGEMSVGDLADAVELSQSARSQHLAKMREDGLLATGARQRRYLPHRRPKRCATALADQELVLPVTGPTRSKRRKP